MTFYFLAGYIRKLSWNILLVSTSFQDGLDLIIPSPRSYIFRAIS